LIWRAQPVDQSLKVFLNYLSTLTCAFFYLTKTWYFYPKLCHNELPANTCCADLIWKYTFPHVPSSQLYVSINFISDKTVGSLMRDRIVVISFEFCLFHTKMSVQWINTDKSLFFFVVSVILYFYTLSKSDSFIWYPESVKYLTDPRPLHPTATWLLKSKYSCLYLVGASKLEFCRIINSSSSLL
jgi:hypothetical protein